MSRVGRTSRKKEKKHKERKKADVRKDGIRDALMLE